MFSVSEGVESSYFIYNELLIGCCRTPSITIRPLVSKIFLRKAKKIVDSSFLQSLSIKSDEIRYKNLSREYLTDLDLDARVEMLSKKCFSDRSPWTSYLIESNISKVELGFLDIDIDLEASKCLITERIYNKDRKVKHILFRNVVVAAAKLVLDLLVNVGLSFRYLEFVILKGLGDNNLKHHEFMRLASFNVTESEEEVRFTIEISKILVNASIVEIIPRPIILPRVNQMKLHLRFGECPTPIKIPSVELFALPELSLAQDGLDRISELFKMFF